MTKVKVYEKKISQGRRSLFLDFYPPIIHPETKRETRREHLRLYVFERPKTESEKEQNKETKMLAENIRAKRQIEFQAGNYGFSIARQKQKDYLQFVEKLAETKKSDSNSNYENWSSVIKYLKNFANGVCRFGDLDEKFCNDFKEFLLKHPNISNNTASSYFDKFKASIHRAYDEKMIAEDFVKNIKSIKVKNTKREFLTFEEFKKLAETPFDEFDDLRRASLFSVFTGLRYSDIEKLTWSEVQFSKEQGYYIRFRQKKTEEEETLPVSDEAIELLGDQGESNQRVFENLQYWQCERLPIWLVRAGIEKKITFHCFRHTHATLQITNGTDIYTVSKLLGHRSIKTTQIYAQIIDEKKREAVNTIKLR